MDPRTHPKCSSEAQGAEEEHKSAQDDPRSAPEAILATHLAYFRSPKWRCRRRARQQCCGTSQRGDFSLHAGSNPLALGGIPVSPVGPGLTSKTGLGLEREHQKRISD